MSARQIADEIRDIAPEQAAKIDAAIAEHGESVKVTATVVVTLKKFDGEYSADKEPVDVIVREGSL